MRAGHRRLVLRFAAAPERRPAFPGALSCEGAGREWTVVCNGAGEALRAAARAAGAEIVEERAASLDEIFIARVKG